MFGIATKKELEMQIERLEGKIREICPHKEVKRGHYNGGFVITPRYECVVCGKLFNIFDESIKESYITVESKEKVSSIPKKPSGALYKKRNNKNKTRRK